MLVSRPMDPAFLVEQAETEPILGNRMGAVRVTIDAAAQALDTVDAPELRARVMLRLAQLKMAENDYDAADRALEAVGRHVPDHAALRFLTGIRACRVALRRGPKQRAEAGQILVTAATRVPQFDDGDPIWQRVSIELALAIAELAVHDDAPDEAAFAALRELVEAFADDRTQIDTVFVGRQLLATFALGRGELEAAARSLRAVLKLAHDVDSPADEIEARLTLAAVLVELGGVGKDEAVRHIDKAKAIATQHGLKSLEQASLLAQAGLLAESGKTAAALDRVLELARGAAADKDLPRYIAAVAIMAELYARRGDHVSAFRTIAEASHALSTATGQDAAHLFREPLARLRDRIGEARLGQIAEDVAKANQLSEALAGKSSSDPS
jgi:ATP/maltotriose-dependent transcriptional regulator MalT